jgi:hypothetical protein
VPPVRVRLTAAKTGLRRHRKLHLARPLGSDSASTPEDGLRLAQPPGLGLSLDLGRQSPPRPTPGARTQPRPRTTVSASPDPRSSDSASTSEDGLRLARPPGPDSASTSDDGLRLARPPGLGLSLDLGRRSPPRPTPGPGLSLDLGGASALPDLEPRPTTSHGGPSLPYP